MTIHERNATEAIAGNETLQCTTPTPKEYMELWKQINNIGFMKAIDIYSPNN